MNDDILWGDVEEGDEVHLLGDPDAAAAAVRRALDERRGVLLPLSRDGAEYVLELLPADRLARPSDRSVEEAATFPLTEPDPVAPTGSGVPKRTIPTSLMTVLTQG